MTKTAPSIRIRFVGAADTVTGSCTMISIGSKSWLVDCGLFQGRAELRQRNWRRLNLPLEDISGIFLTHAHLDHSGYLPKIVKQGYRGPIFCSQGTADLCGVLLRDAAYLEEEQAKFVNTSGYSKHDPAQPLFCEEDVEEALKLIEVKPRAEWIEFDEGASFRFVRAGHIIGANCIQFAFTDDYGHQKIISFTGDLGNDRMKTMRPPEVLDKTDVLVCESTYGDRLQPRVDGQPAFAEILNRVLGRSGVVVIPAFAVGRAQEVIYRIRLLENEGKIPIVPVVLDSPMASAATEIFQRHPEDHTLASAFTGDEKAMFPQLFWVSETADESMLTCMQDGPLVVISAAGMLSGGRILHHLKHRLGDEKNAVIFTGYQAEGTKGRFLQDNAKDGLSSLRIHHKEVPLECDIYTLDHLSSHADYEDTLTWISKMQQLPKLVILNHGSETAQANLAKLITKKFNIECLMAHEHEDVQWPPAKN